eukprot:6902939-Karenia_brevis.AAC.1
MRAIVVLADHRRPIVLRYLLLGELLLEDPLAVFCEVTLGPDVESVELGGLLVRQMEIQGLAARVLIVPGAGAKGH